jgi:general secretion pathway protein H
MPISVPGISSSRGFTLIELLVVLLVMGLFAGLVGAMAHPDDRVVLRVEADRLAQLLDLAAVESRLTGKRIAWTATLTADGAQYRFWRWHDDAGWSEARDDSLRARSLPPGMAISDLRIEAMRPPDGIRLEFSPHGSLAYDFQMSLRAARYAVAASPVGEVRIYTSAHASR